jgi:hypothetical protein
VRRTLKMGKEVHVLAGQVSFAGPLPGLFLHPINPEGLDASDALRDARRHLAATAARVLRYAGEP